MLLGGVSEVELCLVICAPAALAGSIEQFECLFIEGACVPQASSARSCCVLVWSFPCFGLVSPAVFPSCIPFALLRWGNGFLLFGVVGSILCGACRLLSRLSCMYVVLLAQVPLELALRAARQLVDRWLSACHGGCGCRPIGARLRRRSRPPWRCRRCRACSVL